MEFVASLRLGDKLLPTRNPDIAWFWIFLPAMVGYLALLMASLNGKPFIGSIVSYDSEFDKFAASTYPIEVIATGMKWAEGPLWIDIDDSMPYLLYSDTVQNRIYKWEQGKGFFTVGKTMYLPKSGCREEDDEGNSTLSEKYCESLAEPGSSGLASVYTPTLDKASQSSQLDMLVCQHGMRSIALQRDNGTRSIVVSHFKDQKLNAPADMAWSPEGHLYFTDPDFGLRGRDGEVPEGSLEQPVSGLYMVHANDIAKAVMHGEPAKNVFLIDGKLSHPKGLAFSPGFSRLYVGNADQDNAYWKVYDVNSNGLAHKGRLFYNATAVGVPEGAKGKPGGIKTDIMGNVYATGPGGVFIFSPEAKLLGKFSLDREVTGLAFGTDGRLYMTAEDALLRKWLKTKPAKKPSEAISSK